MDPQHPVRRRRACHESSHFQGHRQHETEVVVRVFADQIDAAGCAEDANVVRGPIDPPEFVDHGWFLMARQAMSSRKSPNTSNDKPEYRLTFTVVRSARVSGAKMP